ncbi:MAG: cyclopentanol dehydrogenase [Dehalococcoidia bacterium]|nr:cyclopentanol dehydrogenase [Dehalococcoidia bacterium]
MNRLSGKVALISGSTSGMGAEEAKLFAREGAKIVVTGISKEQGLKVVDEINSRGGESLFIKLDVSSEDDWIAAIRATQEAFGGLNILVNNAGIIERYSLNDTTILSWRRVMEVNSMGVFLGCKAAMPALIKEDKGSIVNIASISGMVGVGYPAYNASKGAIRAFTKIIAMEYAQMGIRVNCINPGSIETPMFDTAETDVAAQRVGRIPMGRVGQPIDVAFGALFLASDESSFITGTELVIDGGLTAC